MLLVAFTGYQALKAKTALQSVASDLDTLRGQITRRRPERRPRHAGRRPASRARGSGQHPRPRVVALEPAARRRPQRAGGAHGRRGERRAGHRRAARRAHGDGHPHSREAAAREGPDRPRPDPGRARRPSCVPRPGCRRRAARSRASTRPTSRPRSASPVRELQTKIAEADALADRASIAVRLLPGMLGGDGERRYLFVFQNNAEIRATGGIPGAFAADHRLGRQGEAGTPGRRRHDRGLREAADAADRPGEDALRPRDGALPAGGQLHPRLPAVGRADRGDVREAQPAAARRGVSAWTRWPSPRCCGARVRSSSEPVAR